MKKNFILLLLSVFLALSAKAQQPIHSNELTPTISGVNWPSSSVDVYVDGVKVGTTTTSTEGIWTFQLSGPMAEGEYSYYGIAVNKLIVDFTAPDKPEITNPTIVDNPDNPFIQVGECLEGTGEVGATATIYVDGVKHGTTIVDQDGNWVYCFAPELEEGDYEFCVTLTDKAGNVSEQTCVDVEVIVDTTPPTPPVIDPVDPNDPDGPGDPDGPEIVITPDGCIKITGEPFALATVYVDGEKHGTVKLDENGEATYCFAPELEEGEHEICVTLTDKAGNVSGQTCVDVEVVNGASASISLSDTDCFSYGDILTMEVENIVGITPVKIEWLANDEKIGEGNPYSHSWLQGEAGLYTIKCVLTDSDAETFTFTGKAIRVLKTFDELQWDLDSRKILATGISVGETVDLRTNYHSDYFGGLQSNSNVCSDETVIISGGLSFMDDQLRLEKGIRGLKAGTATFNHHVSNGNCISGNFGGTISVYDTPESYNYMSVECVEENYITIEGTPGLTVVLYGTLDGKEIFVSEVFDVSGKAIIYYRDLGINAYFADANNLQIADFASQITLTSSVVSAVKNACSGTPILAPGMKDAGIYPNPVESDLYINGEDVSKIEVYSLLGNRVIAVENPGAKIDVTKLVPANYIAKIYHGDNVNSVKFIKK